MAVFPEALPAGVPHHEPAGAGWALVPDLLRNTAAFGADWKADNSVSNPTNVPPDHPFDFRQEHSTRCPVQSVLVGT